LHFLSFKDVESRVGPDWQAPQGADAESKDRKRLFESARLPHTLPALVFLGIDDRPDASKDSVPAQVDPRNPQGVPYFAIDADKEDWVVEGAEFGDARASASSMSGWEAGVFAQARALIDWNCRNLVSGLYQTVVLLTSSSVRLVDLEHTLCGEDGRGAVLLPSRTQRRRHPASPPKAYTTSPTHVPIL